MGTKIPKDNPQGDSPQVRQLSWRYKEEKGICQEASKPASSQSKVLSFGVCKNF